MMADPIDLVAVGRRVWTEPGLHGHGWHKVNVPPATGGIVVSSFNEMRTIDNPLYNVKWDTGQTSTHYFGELKCIGQARTLCEFHEAILAGAERAKVVIGPNGGLRRFDIYLKDGAWAQDAAELREQLENLKIPIEVEHLQRKPRRKAE
jgi:hypothetical protein